jgi:lysine 2,3-aminomutase
MKSIRKPSELLEKQWIRDEDFEEIKKVADTFSIAISAPMVELIENHNTRDNGIRKQFVPSSHELNIKENEVADPISDFPYSPVPGLVHRYPDRCLLKVVNVCPVYCRFCFRREQLGKPSKSMSKEELENAYQYIESHPEIWEVILTGGDPLILKPKMLSEILERLSQIPHVDVIRFHTRIPVVEPDRISKTLIKALKISKAVFILLHANHPDEFTPAAIEACAKIIDNGIPMLSQSVLLKGINDSPEILAKLMKTFVKNRIKPYYLHHGDLAKGTSHFRTTLKEGQNLMQALRGHHSGLCQPTYVLDIPGGFGKIPVNPNYVTVQDSQYVIEDYQGHKHFYSDKTDSDS